MTGPSEMMPTAEETREALEDFFSTVLYPDDRPLDPSEDYDLPDWDD